METIPVKEGIVLPPEDLESTAAPRRSTPRPPGMRAQVRIYRGGWWLPIALGVGIPLLFVAGIFIFTILMTMGLGFLIVRSLFGFGRPLRTRSTR